MHCSYTIYEYDENLDMWYDVLSSYDYDYIYHKYDNLKKLFPLQLYVLVHIIDTT